LPRERCRKASAEWFEMEFGLSSHLWHGIVPGAR
jgi:hypothetical protein